MNTSVLEHRLIDRLIADMPRSPQQLNKPHECDAELLALPGGPTILAVTTDSVVEEISTGLYADLTLAGWMAVTVNASDLAAVGATPLGILVSECLPLDMTEDELQQIQRGIAEAARIHRLPLLGGDTNTSASLQLTGTAIGMVSEGVPITRRGCIPGDLLLASGSLGLGTAFAFQRLFGQHLPQGEHVPFRPVARLVEGQLLRRLATACMDTSDGVIATVDELMRINDVGMRMSLAWDHILHPAALHVARAADLPPWTMLAGPHGEFELLFTIPRDQQETLRSEAASIGWEPIHLGEVVAASGCSLWDGTQVMTLDTTRIRNLFAEVGGDPERYLSALTRGPTHGPPILTPP